MKSFVLCWCRCEYGGGGGWISTTAGVLTIFGEQLCKVSISPIADAPSTHACSRLVTAVKHFSLRFIEAQGREENCSAGGGGGTRKPTFPTPPPSLAAVTGGGVQGKGARPAVPGGGGVNPTSMAQNDTHVALVILTTQMWGGGGGGIIGGKNFFGPKFCVPAPLAPTSVLTQNKGPDTEPHFSNPPPLLRQASMSPPPPPPPPAEQFSGRQVMGSIHTIEGLAPACLGPSCLLAGHSRPSQKYARHTLPLPSRTALRMPLYSNCCIFNQLRGPSSSCPCDESRTPPTPVMERANGAALELGTF